MFNIGRRGGAGRPAAEEIIALYRRYDALLIVNDDPLLAKVICRLPGSIFRCRGVNSSSW